MIGLTAAAGMLGLLYFWLVGHWFARVLVFLGLWLLFSAIVCAALTGALDGLPPPFGIVAAVSGIAGIALSAWGAWAVSGMPIDYRIRVGYPVTLYRDHDGRDWFAEFYENYIRRIS